MHKKQYEIVFLGFGISTMIKIYLLGDNLANKKIAILEKNHCVDLNKNICGFYQSSSLPMSHKWSHFYKGLDDKNSENTLEDIFYGRIDLKKIYEYVVTKKNIDVFYSMLVENISLDDTRAKIQVNEVDGSSVFFYSDMVYDSRPLRREKDSLYQNFLGKEFLFDRPHNIQYPVIMDLEADDELGKVDKSDLSFIYILPLSENKILVEATKYQSSRLSEPSFEYMIKKFMQNNFYNFRYFQINEERGELELTSNSYSKNPKYKNYFCIGSRGGYMRFSTGYCASLMEKEPPYNGARGTILYFLDSFLIKILKSKSFSPNKIFSIFLSRIRHKELALFMSDSPSFKSIISAVFSMPKRKFLTYLLR